MNQAELIDSIATRTGITKKSVKEVLDTLADTTSATLAVGGELTLPGIGKLFAKERAARTGRNPQNGQPLEIAARKVVQFKAVAALKNSVN